MNTIDNWQTVARIHNPERLELNRRVFGGDICPVVSIIPFQVSVPGHPNALAYNLDLKAISAEQRERLVKSIADKFNLDPAFVAENLDSQGVPILAADVVVSSSDQGLMLSILSEALVMGDDWDDDDWEQ